MKPEDEPNMRIRGQALDRMLWIVEASQLQAHSPERTCHSKVYQVLASFGEEATWRVGWKARRRRWVRTSMCPLLVGASCGCLGVPFFLVKHPRNVPITAHLHGHDPDAPSGIWRTGVGSQLRKCRRAWRAFGKLCEPRTITRGNREALKPRVHRFARQRAEPRALTTTANRRK